LLKVVNKWLAGSVSLSNHDLPPELARAIHPDCKFEIREFLPKCSRIFSGLKYLLVFSGQSVLFKPLDLSTSPHKKYPSICLTHLIELSDNSIKLYVDQAHIDATGETSLRDRLEFQVNWLRDTLVPKIQVWCQNIPTDADMSSAKLATLTLYPNMVEDYARLYEELKATYWPRFATTWLQTTSTSPEKFIHEDIAIATYFILVWRHFQRPVEQFVDLGCGNGLLVHILADQGFRGYGIDMRARKIWTNSVYTGCQTRLVERTVDPQTDTFDDCDWLIGNHSDELSPWLSVMAARSSRPGRPCNYLLIPCCLFDFHSKFVVKKKAESRYDTYLAFLERVGRLSGFDVVRDKLRIPSTRNVCIVGRYSQDPSVAEPQDRPLKRKIEELVAGDGGTGEFVARDLVQESAKSARNCTRNVDRDLQNSIVKRVMEHLLSSDRLMITKRCGGEWNAGGCAKLTDVAGLFDAETLAKMKRECGGVKTLLKNFHQLFMACGEGQMRLKVWKPAGSGYHEVYRRGEDGVRCVADEGVVQFTRASRGDGAQLAVKTKRCLFDLWHPDGCLLGDEECDFAHLESPESL